MDDQLDYGRILRSLLWFFNTKKTLGIGFVVQYLLIMLNEPRCLKRLEYFTAPPRDCT